jgi:hypothetical protein
MIGDGGGLPVCRVVGNSGSLSAGSPERRERKYIRCRVTHGDKECEHLMRLDKA